MGSCLLYLRKSKQASGLEQNEGREEQRRERWREGPSGKDFMDRQDRNRSKWEGLILGN